MWLGLGIRITNWWRRAAAANGPFNNHATLTDGLVSYWKLDEASGVRADSVNGHDLTDNNTVTSADPGKHGIAAHFTSGNSEYLSNADFGTDMPRSADRTIAFWFRSSDVTAVKGLIGVGLIPQDTQPIWFLRLNTTISIYSQSYYDGITSLSNDTWYHCVYTYRHTPSPETRVYINTATEVSNTAVDGATFNYANLYVGVAYPGYVTADIDEVGAWNRVLTAQERTDLYNSGAGLFY